MSNKFYPKIVQFMRYVEKCMRFACWIAKATITHPEYVIFTTFQWRQSYPNALQLLPERPAIVTRTHCNCCPNALQCYPNALQLLPERPAIVTRTPCNVTQTPCNCYPNALQLLPERPAMLPERPEIVTRTPCNCYPNALQCYPNALQCYPNALQCYIIRTLPVLFVLHILKSTHSHAGIIQPICGTEKHAYVTSPLALQR